jgi:hypothetical protein
MFDLFDLIADSLNGTAELLTTILSCLPMLLVAALYVLQGLTLTFLCRASRAGSVWMAWVPFANQYLLGKQADVYTDDRVLRGEISPDCAPSTLRRRMLGYSIVERIIGSLAGAAWGLVVLSSLSGFFLALGGFLGGDEAVEGLEVLEPILAGGIVLLLAAGSVFIVFHILYLVAACKAYYRLFRMLDSRVPALWSASAVFIPPLATVMLFAFAVKCRRELTERFFPPMESAEDTTDTEDSATPPPTDSSIPELYSL